MTEAKEPMRYLDMNGVELKVGDTDDTRYASGEAPKIGDMVNANDSTACKKSECGWSFQFANNDGTQVNVSESGIEITPAKDEQPKLNKPNKTDSQGPSDKNGNHGRVVSYNGDTARCGAVTKVEPKQVESINGSLRGHTSQIAQLVLLSEYELAQLEIIASKPEWRRRDVVLHPKELPSFNKHCDLLVRSENIRWFRWLEKNPPKWAAPSMSNGWKTDKRYLIRLANALEKVNCCPAPEFISEVMFVELREEPV